MSKEELTTKMHSEFSISDEATTRLTALMALSDMNKFNYSIDTVCELYSLTEIDISKHQKEFEKIFTA